jgi:hypothetical protein
MVIDSGVVPKLIPLLSHKEVKVSTMMLHKYLWVVVIELVTLQ